jgi:hypothetical protein
MAHHRPSDPLGLAAEADWIWQGDPEVTCRGQRLVHSPREPVQFGVVLPAEAVLVALGADRVKVHSALRVAVLGRGSPQVVQEGPDEQSAVAHAAGWRDMIPRQGPSLGTDRTVSECSFPRHEAKYHRRASRPPQGTAMAEDRRATLSSQFIGLEGARWPRAAARQGAAATWATGRRGPVASV